MARLRVKEVAQQREMTQRALAEQSGVTVQLLNRYWNNNVQRVDLDELEKIAAALGVKIGDLIVSEREQAADRGTEAKEGAA
jgi:DNA-binding Xre family transcriptional regulator